MTKKKRKHESEIAALPPFLAAQAVFNDRIRLAKAFCVGVLVIATAIVIIQEIRFRGALDKALNKDILIVPGVVDFMRVRPGILPDSVVYYFAEYIAEQVGTFNYQNLQAKSQRLSEFLSPSFREVYVAQIRKNFPTYRELSVTEVFNLTPVSKFQLLKDKGGNPYYVVNVEGMLDRYSNDQKLISEHHVITVKFRTTRIYPDKPWFFEVLNISRQSFEDFSRRKTAREQLAEKEK